MIKEALRNERFFYFKPIRLKFCRPQKVIEILKILC